MTKKATAPKLFALAGLGFVVTVFTVMMGTPFLRVLHKAFGSAKYWITGFLSVAVFVSGQSSVFATLVGSVWLLVGVYSELENRGAGWKKAGFLSLLISSLVLVAGFIGTMKAYDMTSWDQYVNFVSEMLENVRRMSPQLKVDPNMIAQQTPSILISMLVLALGNALIFEKAVARYFKVPVDQVASGLKLLEFRLPDSVIWVFLLSLLFSMVNFGITWIGATGFNLVNIGVVLFFFQGLAALEVFFKVMKTGLFFRAIMYIILVGYLFVLLSALGLIDYWVDFRARLRKVPSPSADRA